jgi:diacylglycerol kinase (ATP)
MKKLILSFGYAFKGIYYATKTQLNFRIHLVATFLAVITGLLLKLSADEWKWISLCIALVLTAELMNTALETLTDMVSPDYHIKAGIVKDMAAAAVLITAIFSVIIALIIFLPKFFFLIFTS